jgi:hypothetical protein
LYNGVPLDFLGFFDSVQMCTIAKFRQPRVPPGNSAPYVFIFLSAVFPVVIAAAAMTQPSTQSLPDDEPNHSKLELANFFPETPVLIIFGKLFPAPTQYAINRKRAASKT